MIHRLTGKGAVQQKIPAEMLARCGSVEYAREALRVDPAQCERLFERVQDMLHGRGWINVPVKRSATKKAA